MWEFQGFGWMALPEVAVWIFQPVSSFIFVHLSVLSRIRSLGCFAGLMLLASALAAVREAETVCTGVEKRFMLNKYSLSSTRCGA